MYWRYGMGKTVHEHWGQHGLIYLQCVFLKLSSKVIPPENMESLEL